MFHILLAAPAYQQIPATGYGDLLMSCPLMQCITKQRWAEPSQPRCLNYQSSILMEMGSRAIISADLPVSSGHECLTGEYLQPVDDMNWV